MLNELSEKAVTFFKNEIEGQIALSTGGNQGTRNARISDKVKKLIDSIVMFDPIAVRQKWEALSNDYFFAMLFSRIANDDSGNNKDTKLKQIIGLSKKYALKLNAQSDALSADEWTSQAHEAVEKMTDSTKRWKMRALRRTSRE